MNNRSIPGFSLAPLAVLFALTSARLSAQQEDAATEYTYGVSDNDAAPPPYDGYTRVAVSDFDGDLRADVAALRDGAITVRRAAVVTQQPLAIQAPSGWTANDIAATDMVEDSQSPKLYAVGSDGLRVLEFDAQTASMTNTLTLTGSWVDATRILCGRVGTARLLVGLAADGVTLLYASEVAGVITQFTTLTLPSALVDVALLDWAGDGTLAVAVATEADGLIVIESSGATVLVTSAAAGSFLARLPGDSAADELCWLHQGTGGWNLRVFRAGGSTSDLSLTSVTTPNGLACADLDADGHVDCAITQTDSYSSVVLLRQVDTSSPPVEFFSDSASTRQTFVTWDATHPGTTLDLAPPVFLDADRDSHADVITALSSADAISVKVGIAYDDPNLTEASILPTGIDSSYGIDSSVSSTSYTLALRTDFGSMLASSTHLQVTTWVADFDESSQEWVIDTAERSVRNHPLHGNTSAGGHHEIPIDTEETDAYWGHGHALFFEVRGVTLGTGGEVVAATRSYVIAAALASYSGESDEVYMSAVRNHTNSTGEDEKKVKNPGGNEEIGSLHRTRVVPRPGEPSGSGPSQQTGPTTRAY